ncbi:primosomal protein N' [Pedobacter yulinensis]|uniref:Replication restart protein PriA n=1 Tax=Pedobacter yulinensis TaxID=2126353 RepID=A0A2T3HIC3_9SPHI|nr:primosomal protein N' [Pedobacter yulinensis]PST82153.1 primosomal protein N' [Pedobacter yulinensis]
MPGDITGGFAADDTLFIEVVLPLSLARNYTYRVPAFLNEEIVAGKRVVVQFGKYKMYTALIRSVSTRPPEHYEAKYIIDVVDAVPVVNAKQFAFWEWMVRYYLCNEGDVMAAALPAGLKLASETVLSLRRTGDVQPPLSSKEQLVMEVLARQQRMTISDVIKLLGQKTVYPTVNALLQKQMIDIAEEVSEKYKPLTRSFVSLDDFYKEQENLRQLFDLLEKAPKQLDALLSFMKLSRTGSPVAKQQLLDDSNCGPGAIKALADKQVFRIYKMPVDRLNDDAYDLLLHFELSDAQQAALDEVNAQFMEKDVVLLHGVTASGKTQLYVRLMEKALENGGQILFLLPEIALTTQLVERLKNYFGEKIGVYHSKFNDNERVEIWNKVANGTYRIVLGARSSVFLPFRELQLIVVDEEHESSYKQYDPAPRYQARDAAIYLGYLHGAKVVLGSATPSLESYYNASEGKYGFVKLTERFGGVPLPEQKIISIPEEQKRKKMTAYFSSVLLDDITKAIARKEQVILFQNRRGYATISICATCGYTPKCIHCDVSLTYHKSSGKLHCHYCGYYQNLLNICPACGSVHIEQKGFGTERVEEELQLLFPDLRMARLDLDSTRSRNSLQQIIMDFQERKTDILIGTQMVAKGLDFEGVGLIGVINADTLLNYPEFRALERSYQLLAQVAGRSGRRDKQGLVSIQTYSPAHRTLRQVIENDYEGMYADELAERDQFGYPPFTRLIQIHVRHKDPHVLTRGANELAARLRKLMGPRVLGPEQPLVARIRSYFIMQIMIKADKRTSISKVKEALKDTLLHFHADKDYKGILTQIDVDPY